MVVQEGDTLRGGIVRAVDEVSAVVAVHVPHKSDINALYTIDSRHWKGCCVPSVVPRVLSKNLFERVRESGEPHSSINWDCSEYLPGIRVDALISVGIVNILQIVSVIWESHLAVS